MKNQSENLAGKHTLIRSLGSIETRNDNEFGGIGIPYAETYQAPDYYERFAPGCLTLERNLPLLFNHDRDQVIGSVISGEETPEGYAIRANLAPTERGKEIRTLIDADALTGLSIGFRPGDYEVSEAEDGLEIITHTRIEPVEFSLTAFPAYTTAQVTEKRHSTQHIEEKNNMGNAENTADPVKLEALENRMSDIERRAALGEFTATPGGMSEFEERAAAFATTGEFVKAIANSSDSRHEDANALYRSITTGDIPKKTIESPGFIGDLTKLIEPRRRWTNTFDRASLPAKGMSVDYLKTTATATVAEQVNQLDKLAESGTLKVDNATAKVRTFGGGMTVSQQVIDRSEAWVLNDLFRAFAFDYARQTEKATKKYITDEITKLKAEEGKHLKIATSWGAFDWIAAIVDAAEHFEDAGFSIEGLAVSKDIFVKLAKEAAQDGRPLMNVYGTGVNTVGSIEVKKATGDLMGVTVSVLSKAEDGTAAFYDPVAIRTLEEPGAPLRLQADNVLNLSRDFSLYGYLAHITPYPEALLPVTFES